MTVRLDRIDSDALDGVGYDRASRILTVKFAGGGTYEYYGVSERLYEELLSAQPHPWAELGDVVKSHRYRRIG